ncbi:glycerophosphoryl diester phosphodiesterase [Elusimicrobium posterum]|uniref:hypothetical protein n=1 Tax=Elusimicrobium posterum TaxID=3116653 RepID=UPI003C74F262
MEIISHRGLWTSNKQLKPNSLEAFYEALSNGFGIEVDIRDFDGKIVISHDTPDSASPLLDTLFNFYLSNNCISTIALNVKSDGLQTLLQNMLEKYKINNYFTFDMSVPNTLNDRKNSIMYFARQSEYEPCNKKTLKELYTAAAGIWIDQFTENPDFTQKNIQSIKKHVSEGKQICFVSPELHPWGRNEKIYKKIWQKLLKIEEETKAGNNIKLCTDHTQEAKEFFYGKN